MQVARKITIVTLLTTVAAFTTLGVVEVRREVAAYEVRIGEDLLDLGRGLGHAFHEVARAEGRDRAREVVGYADERLHEVNIRWISLDPAQGSDPHFRREELGALAEGNEQTRIAPNEDGGNGILYVYVPIEGTGNGALELAQSLQKEAEFRRHALRDQALAALLTSVIASLLASIVGLYFVVRPTQRLVAQARRVGLGDLSLRLDLPQKDEMGELGREMNAMCDRLESARAEVARETDARLHTVEQLRHADRLMTVGKLASGIAHELGTPLNVVSGRAKMICDEPTGPLVAENAQIIRSQTERMATIIRHLLDFARRREPRRVATDLRAVARQTLSLVAPLAQKHGVALELDAGEPARASVDPMQLEQVVSNLVVNAIHAMPKGGNLNVSIRREALAPPSDDGAKAAEIGCLSLYVRDAGEGIPAEHRERIFEPFFTTKGVGEGTGLGLSVAYGIVADHGGWISVETRPREGSTFGVHLPDAPLPPESS